MAGRSRFRKFLDRYPCFSVDQHLRTIGDMAEPEIGSDEEHEAALREIEALWDAKDGAPDGARLEELAARVEAYEERQWPVLNSDREGRASRIGESGMDCYAVAQAKAQWYKLIRRVEGGETIEITRDGRTVASIERRIDPSVPATDPGEAARRLAAPGGSALTRSARSRAGRSGEAAKENVVF
jgi:antitoxin (DNA-binding transcriptional repressor) of toxin-antitoxin stability system